MKVCRTCKVAKPPRQFYRKADYADGRRSDCIECHNAYTRERYRLKREQILEWHRRYRSSEHGQAMIRAYKQSPRGRAVQREADRFHRGMRRMEAV